MVLDNNLYLVHRKMLNITFFNEINNIIFNNITYSSNLYISESIIINTNTSINSYLYITNNSLLNNVTANSISVINQGNSNLINTDTINIKDVLINNNLYNFADTIMNKSGSILSTLHTYNLTADTIITNNITANNIVISSKIINIGTTNSKINIYSKSIKVSTNETVINDNVLELNINISTLTPFDVGNQSGFEILGLDTNDGFIKTNTLGDLFEIKYPKKILSEYILNVDDTNNLTILGTTNIINNLTINSSLYIANKSFLNNISITSILYSNDNINTYNTSTAYSIVYINNKLICNDNIKIINSNLIVNNDSILYNNISILSNINVASACIINNNVINSDVYVNNDICSNKNIYINNNLSVTNIAIINNNLTVLSFLNLHNNCLVTNNLTINSNLNLGNIKNNDITITSNLNILGNGTLNDNNTFGTVFNTVSILGKVLLSDKILDYTSSDLADITGIPMGKLYRTGGILKIKIAKLVGPVMTLLGSSIVTLIKRSDYIEQGVSSISNNGDILKSYIISIGPNILVSPIEAIINSTVILGVIPSGICNIVYKSFDTDNNVEYITRILNILTNIIPPTMKLIGLNSVSLAVRSNYVELGVISTSYYNENLKSYIVSIGNTILNTPMEVIENMSIPLISTLALGTYNIVYKSTDNDGNIQNITRILNVIKNITPPDMQLIGSSTVSLQARTNYIDLGVISTSIYKENLKSYIISIGSNILTTSTEAIPGTSISLTSTLLLGAYNIVYNSTDNDSNVQTITRILNITKNIIPNTIPPTMLLLGLSEITLTARLNYNDFGVTSTSYYYEVLTSYIISIGSTILTDPIQILSTSTPVPLISTLAIGTYNIVYKSSDTDGNIQTIIRKLTIVKNIIPPTMLVLGLGTVTLLNGTSYIDAGVTSTSFYNDVLTSYIISIGTTVFATPIPITSTSTSVPLVSTLTFGIYSITYQSTDSNENIQTCTRKLIIDPPLYTAYVINTTSPNAYNTSTSNFNTLITWDSGINNSNIVWTYVRMANYRVIPIITSNYFYFPTNTTATSFCLSKSFLSNIDINSTWCFVIKCKFLSGSNSSNFTVYLDTKLDTFFTPNSVSADYYVTECEARVSYRVLASVTIQSSANFTGLINQVSGSLVSNPVTNNITNTSFNISIIPSDISIFLDGVFIKIYKPDATTIGIDLINAADVVLLSIKRLNVRMKNSLPFTIISSTNIYKYYDGFVYSSNDIPYSSYKTYFPSGTVFA